MSAKQLQSAQLLDVLSVQDDPIETILNFDYFASKHALPDHYSLDVNSLIATDAYSEKDKFITNQREKQFQLI